MNNLLKISNLIKTLLDRKKDPFLHVPKNPKTRLAYIISRILGPTPLICLLWLLTSIKSGIGLPKALWVYPLIFFTSIAVPLIIGTYLIFTKRVKDIEWSDLKQREKYLPPIILFSLTTLTILVWKLTNSTLFHLALLFDFITITMITIYFVFNLKASMHIMFATVTFAGIVLFFGFQYFWVFILLLPIMWARHTLKVHTLPELLAGFFVPAVFILTALLLFGWPKI